MKIRALSVTALALLSAGRALAQNPLLVHARDDRPAPVQIRCEVKDVGGSVLINQVLQWTADDNGWSTQPSTPISVPDIATVVRLTFINDQGGGTPDTDRNAFIDYLFYRGILREAEDFDRTGGLPGPFKGCVATTLDGRGIADCGNNFDWVEYDLPFGIGAQFCNASDDALLSCPCSPGNPDTGCELPQGTGGVNLSTLAQTTNPNRATVQGTGFSTMGSPTAIVVRSILPNAPTPAIFGDGLLCLDTGPPGVVRLAATTAMGGVSLHTFGHSGMAGSSTTNYQLWFRSTPSTYCDPFAGFNVSNGATLVW